VEQRERLIEIIQNSVGGCARNWAEIIADGLIANGVIVPPCNVGDTVYVKWRLHRNSNYGIYPVKVYALRWDEKKNNFRVCVEGEFEISPYDGKYTHYYRGTFAWNNVGKTVFFTKEEAEAELERRTK
jgi:hypothetical protein